MGSAIVMVAFQPGPLVAGPAFVLGAEVLFHAGQDQHAHQGSREAAVVQA